MKSKIGISLLGGTGYGAGELLRLLVQHPGIEVASVVSTSAAGESLVSRHSHLRGFYDQCFDSELDLSKLKGYEKSYLITALPHGASGTRISEIIDEAEAKEISILDLSGDVRLSDPEQRKKFYPESSASDYVQQAFCYGMTELRREEIKKAKHISNPGCFVTSATLAAAPIVTQGLHQGQIIFDGKSGSSGGGKTPDSTFHHPERHGNVNAYKVLEHRHEPEIRQALGDASGTVLQTSFAPHVIPVARGMYVTCYLQLKDAMSADDLKALYEEFYADSFFVRISDKPAELQDVVGSNFCDIFVTARDSQVVITSALDNLVKGMAGQAIQNINLNAGLSEELGLRTPALRPI